MDNLLLAKKQLPEGVIDASVGEPYAVRECLNKLVELEKGFFCPDENTWNYPNPNGYQPLVSLLENKHQAPVIITNGAKQALAASFYAVQKLGWNKMAMKLPYWALIPPLAKAHGIEMVSGEPLEDIDLPYLLLAPNNPDGQCLPLAQLKEIASAYKDNGIPFIHDAAYFTHTYLPENYELGAVGDLQIYSISKIFGLSGLRVGYIVCYDESYVPLIKEYMEMMTVGVSSVSQQFVHNLLSWEYEYNQEFTASSRQALTQAKKLVKGIPKDILEIPDNIEDIPGMFGWFKVGPKADFDKAKVHFIDGKFFGMPGYIRMNLAIPQNKLIEIILRLNK